MERRELKDQTRTIMDTATAFVIRGRRGRVTATNLKRKQIEFEEKEFQSIINEQ